MTRIPLHLPFARRPERRAARRRSAARRLSNARLRFERSSRVLRKAAFDHIEAQALVGAVLEATLARLAAQGGGT